MPFIQTLLHEDTLSVRSHECPNHDILHFHDKFTWEDSQAGWRTAGGFWLETPEDIAAHEQGLLRSHQAFWDRIVQDLADVRLVWKGYHYTVHALGTTAGFGGRVFEVQWLDPQRPPTVCHLWSQGRIPAWVRDKLPDNAVSFTERGDIPSPFEDLETSRGSREPFAFD